MSIGSFGGILGSSAGAPLPQSKGSQVERSQTDAAAQDRKISQDEKADSAAGVGETAEDQESGDRDADGRRLWERPASSEQTPSEEREPPPQSKDATGSAGNSLDLTG